MNRGMVILLKEFCAALFLLFAVGIILAPLQSLLEQMGFREFAYSTQMVDKIITFLAVVLFMGMALWLHYDAYAERVLRKKESEPSHGRNTA